VNTTISEEIAMKRSRTLKPRRYIVILFMSCLMSLCLSGQNESYADDTLDVKRDSDKTVYTIGASDEKNNALGAQRDKEKNVYSIGSSKEKRNEEALKQERSWDMLMNMGVWQENPEQKRSSEKQPPQNQPPKDKPHQNHPQKSQPPQPSTGS
jgi:hypothetical protein